MAAIKDFVVLNKINYTCIALSQNKFVLSDLPITINLSKCEKTLYFLYKSKKVPQDFETLHCHFRYISDKVICHILNNIENVKKIHFLTQKHICHSCTLGKIY